MDKNNEEHADCPAAACSREGQLAELKTRITGIERRHNEMQESQIRIFGKLEKLIRHFARLEGLIPAVETLNKLIPAVARLEVKAGIWGGIGGILAALLVIGIAVATQMK
jgi:hypothetical protein